MKKEFSGTVFFDKNLNKWTARLSWKDLLQQEHKRKKYCTSKTEAEEALMKFNLEKERSLKGFKVDQLTFEEFSKHWLNDILRMRLKPASLMRKDVTLRNQVNPILGNCLISEITHSDVQNMVTTLTKTGLSYSVIKKAYEAVNGCLREYRVTHGITYNPCENITLPVNKKKETSEIKYFTSQEQALIIKEATRKHGNGSNVYRLGASIVLLMYTGMRIGELLALTWRDVDFQNKTISINKNAVFYKDIADEDSKYELRNQDSTKTFSGKRIIPMTDMAYKAMQELYSINKDKRYIMATKTGKQVTPRNINRMFHSVLRETGIAQFNDEYCGVHTLRHTFATMLFSNGCDTKIVSELLGHSDTKITENIYIHIIQQQKISAMQGLDKFCYDF